MRVGFAGAGNMAGAIARGWAGAEGGPDAMLFCDLDVDRAEALAAAVDGETRESLPAVAAEADVVVLAVKPVALDDVATALDHSAPALISVLAATPVARIAETFPGVPLVRVMPNQPVEVRRGVLCYVPPEADMSADLASDLIALLGLLGTTVPLEEPLLEGAMAIMSCSPAYVALFAEALASGGEREGLEAELARDLVAATLEGTAELLRVKPATAIRQAVAPPGGATEAGLQALEEGGFEAAIAAAVNASLERFR